MNDVTTTQQSSGRVLESGDVITISKGDDCDSIVYNRQSYTSAFEIIVNSSDINLTLVGTEKSGGGACLLPFSKVMLANGQNKLAKDLKKGDKLLTYNHFKGCFEEKDILVNIGCHDGDLPAVDTPVTVAPGTADIGSAPPLPDHQMVKFQAGNGVPYRLTADGKYLHQFIFRIFDN